MGKNNLLYQLNLLWSLSWQKALAVLSVCLFIAIFAYIISNCALRLVAELKCQNSQEQQFTHIVLIKREPEKNLFTSNLSGSGPHWPIFSFSLYHRNRLFTPDITLGGWLTNKWNNGFFFSRIECPFVFLCGVGRWRNWDLYHQSCLSTSPVEKKSGYWMHQFSLGPSKKNFWTNPRFSLSSLQRASGWSFSITVLEAEVLQSILSLL